MANKMIAMIKLRQVLRLHQQGKGKRFISMHLQVSRNTVKIPSSIFLPSDPL